MIANLIRELRGKTVIKVNVHKRTNLKLEAYPNKNIDELRVPFTTGKRLNNSPACYMFV